VTDPYGLSALYVWEFQFLRPKTRWMSGYVRGRFAQSIAVYDSLRYQIVHSFPNGCVNE
jgi:hypothetical protein